MEKGLQIEVSEENMPVVVEFLEELNDRIGAMAKARGITTEAELRELLKEEFLDKPAVVLDRETSASLKRIKRLASITM